MSAQALRLRGLTVGYGHQAVAAVPDMDLAPGRLHLVSGANGSGKTTLLKTLARLLAPVGGRIDPPMAPGPGGAVYVHSTPFLFRGTVRHNLRVVPGACAEAVDRWLETLDLGDLASARVAILSAGQRQRVALARAMVAAPRHLLLDEPEGGLDDLSLARWRRVLAQLVRDAAVLVVLAAHRPTDLDAIPATAIRLTRPRAASGGQV